MPPIGTCMVEPAALGSSGVNLEAATEKFSLFAQREGKLGELECCEKSDEVPQGQV